MASGLLLPATWTPQQRQLVVKAEEVARGGLGHEVRDDGTTAFDHAVAVAAILLDWNADAETVAAGLLHDVLEDTEMGVAEMRAACGDVVVFLVQGVTKFTQGDVELWQGQDRGSYDRKVETLRKLFEVMRDDIRVVIIKLADRLHNVRTMASFDAKRAAKFAKETLDVYYKIAYHLGMNDVRREFSERCTPFLEPDIAESLKALREAMEPRGQEALADVRHMLDESDSYIGKQVYDVRLEFHSLASLLDDRRRPDFTDEQVFYLVIVVASVDACYGVLKTIHGKMHPRGNRFRDFIAAPTAGGYSSIHTTVIDRNGRIIDIRIRTPQMDQQECRGILDRCFGLVDKDDHGLEWLQRSEQLDEATRASSSAFWEALQSDILQETVQVVVDGKEVLLPRGSTVLDAVYARYGRAAKGVLRIARNGANVSFGEAAGDDDAVSAERTDGSAVQFDWLRMVTTSYARTLIAEALKERSRDEKLLVGRRLLQKELDYEGHGLLADVSRVSLREAASHFQRPTFDDVIAMVGEGILQPRDVIVVLYPERRRMRWWHRSLLKEFPFRVQVSGSFANRADILAKLYATGSVVDVVITGTNLRIDPGSHTFVAVIRGRAKDRIRMAEFFSAIERHEWVSQVHNVLSLTQIFTVVAAFCAAAAVVMLDILLLPLYSEALTGPLSTRMVILQILPLLPVLGVNAYLLLLLRHYVVLLRQGRWFLGMGFVLNIFGVLLVLWKLPLLNGHAQVLPVIFLFAIAMLGLAYKYAQTYFALEQPEPIHRPSSAEWVAQRREKHIGYALRLGAVLIWGLEPVLIRYTPMQQLSPLLRVNIWAFVGCICGYFAIWLKNRCSKPESRLAYTTSYNRFFWLIVFANVSYNYFLHASLLFTSATNVNLVLGYAPIFSLLLGFMIWRKRIAYFRSPVAMQQMVLVFALSTVGGSLLFFNDMQRAGGGIIGDMLALLIAFSDVAFMMANIYYVKYSKSCSNTLALTTQHLFWIGIVTTVLIQFNAHVLGNSLTYASLTPAQWYASIALGMITMVGFVLTFEAFKRIDGLLAFLMLNLAPVIAFIPEFLFFNVRITSFFLIGAFLIVVSSIAAELVNSRAEKTGL